MQCWKTSTRNSQLVTLKETARTLESDVWNIFDAYSHIYMMIGAGESASRCSVWQQNAKWVCEAACYFVLLPIEAVRSSVSHVHGIILNGRGHCQQVSTIFYAEQLENASPDDAPGYGLGHIFPNAAA